MSRLPRPHRDLVQRHRRGTRDTWILSIAYFCAISLALITHPATAATPAWPLASKSQTPVTIRWADGTTSPALFSGFDLDYLPTLDIDPATPEGVLDDSAGNYLVARVRGAPDGEVLNLPPLTLDSISFSPLELRTYGSNVSARYFLLGPPNKRIPPPPDWHTTWEDSPLWRQARPAPIDPTWTYLSGAAWLWTTSDLITANGEAVLFRQRFVLPTNRAVLRARLTVQADSTLVEGYLNGHALPWRATTLGGRSATAAVERILRPGTNQISLSIAAPTTGEIDTAGFAWQLQLILAPGAPERSGENALLEDRWPYPPFTLRTMDGGWIPAERVRIDESAVRVERAVGERMQFHRAAVRWIEHFPRTSLDDTAAGLLPYASPSVDLSYDDIVEGEGIWVLDGTFHRGHLSQWNPDPKQLGTPDGDPATWRGDRPVHPAVQGIRSVLVSPSAGDVRWDIPTADLARNARILLRDGSLLRGLLDRSTGDRLTVLLPGGSETRIRAEEIVRVDFPSIPSVRARWAFERLRSAADARIGLLGEVPCRGGAGCPESVLPSLHRIAEAMGVSTQWLKPQDILVPDLLSPGRFPVLVNLDQYEAYYHTIQRSGDGHQALLQYMNRGGILIHLVPGTPFFYGRQAHARQWALVPLGGGLNRAFGMDVGVPGASGPGVVFEIPENSPEPLEFRRIAAEPWRHGLPPAASFPSLADSRFRPISPQCQRAGGEVIPLYRLVRGNADYGLAAAVVRLPAASPDAPPAYSVYIAWPLAMARDHLGDSLLPAMLPPIIEAIAIDRQSYRAGK